MPDRLKKRIGADGEIRTPTGVSPPPPQGGVSTNFTTSAKLLLPDDYCAGTSSTGTSSIDTSISGASVAGAYSSTIGASCSRTSVTS